MRAELALPEEASTQRAFGRASRMFELGSVVHDYARDVLLGNLRYFDVEPKVIVDLGSGTGRGLTALSKGFPDARIVGIDASLPMCRAATNATTASTGAQVLVGRAEEAPICSGSADLVIANLVLPWCRPERLFADVARTLSPRGAFLFSSVGPDTLREVRRAWTAVDSAIHVHAAIDMHDLGDLAARAGLSEPVMSNDRLTLTYGDVRALVHDLRACGGTNVAAGRRKTLTGIRRWNAFEQALAGDVRRFAVSVELVFGHAWAPRSGPREIRAAEIAIPVEGIKWPRPN
jgi:malonyl-CoA O-methyltransferase